MKRYYIDSLPKEFPRSVATVGMFDGVHRGHRALLDFVKTEAERHQAEPLVITFDTHPRVVLKKDIDSLRLLNTDRERFDRLSETGIENLLVIPFNKTYASLSASEFLDILRPGVNMVEIVMGYDNHFGRKNTDNPDILNEYGRKNNIEISKADIILQAQGMDISSTAIRKALCDGNLELANEMLGYPYTFSGRVVHGFARGRELSFPTANLNIDPHKQLPPLGVYAVRISVAGNEETTYRGMLNLGVRPSFALKDFSAEVHLLDYNGNLYGRTLIVEPVAKIREERKFSDIDLLKARLQKDENEVRKILS